MSMFRSMYQCREIERAFALVVALVAVYVAANLTPLPAADAAPQFVWAGEAVDGSPEWSLGSNWAGRTAPSAPGPVALEFPRLAGSGCGACYTSKNDLSGLTAESLRIDDGDKYILSGDALRLGVGGLVATPSIGSSGQAGDIFSMPLELAAAQSWSISGRGEGEPGENGVLLADGVTGAGSNLTVGLAHDAALILGGDSEVGSVAVNGAHGAIAMLEGKLNATDGAGVAVNGVIFSGAGAVGPLTSTGAVVVPFPRIEAASATFGSGSELVMTIGERGDTAGSDYSVLTAQGDVDLQSPSLAVEAITEGCEPFPHGRTYTILSTTGVLEGSFGDAAEGAKIPIVTAEKCLVRQFLRIAYHRSGSVESVIGTVVEEDEPPPIPETQAVPFESGLTQEEIEEAEKAGEEETANYQATLKRQREEREKREASETWQFPSHPAPPSYIGASLLSDRLAVVRGGQFALVRLRCEGSSDCRGQVTLAVTSKSAHGRNARQQHVIGSAGYSIAPEKVSSIKLKLNAYGHMLIRFHSPKISARLGIAPATGTPGHRESVAVRLRRGW
jgi:hypothetical protein